MPEQDILDKTIAVLDSLKELPKMLIKTYN